VWIGTVSGVLGVIAPSVAAQTVLAFLVNSSGALMFVRLHDDGADSDTVAKRG